MDNCIIDRIVNKSEPASIIYEDNNFIVFLDTKPLFIGHTLVAPKVHYKTLYDLPAWIVEDLFLLTQSVGVAVEEAMNSEGSFIAINNTVSQSIQHVHIHIVPRNKGDGLRGFFWPRTKYKNQEQMINTKDKIRAKLKIENNGLN